jgi:hypothetical protein
LLWRDRRAAGTLLVFGRTLVAAGDGEADGP